MDHVEPSDPIMQASTVLVVDDYADARESLRDMLEELGHQVVEAANGREALDFLLYQREKRVSLILLDLDMPVMDGWQFLEVVGSYLSLSAIPVLVVSAHTARLDPTKQRGLAGVIQTPVDLSKLRATVTSLAPALAR